MRYEIHLLALMFLTVLNVHSQEIKPAMSNFDTFLSEVFVNEGKINPETRQYQYFKDLYQNRLIYKKVDEEISKKIEFQLLSEIPLNTTYNSMLSRDNIFNPTSFNPFKYNFNFYSKSIQVIKLENTNYVMVIYPQVIPSLNRP